MRVKSFFHSQTQGVSSIKLNKRTEINLNNPLSRNPHLEFAVFDSQFQFSYGSLTTRLSNSTTNPPSWEVAAVKPTCP